MAKASISAIALVVFCAVASAEEPGLYQVSVDVPGENGARVSVTFKEIERTPTKSVVELSALAGGSVSGPMMIMRFMCGLTRARGEQFFISRPLSRNPIRMEVTFLKSAPPPSDVRDLRPTESVLSIAQCNTLQL